MQVPIGDTALRAMLNGSSEGATNGSDRNPAVVSRVPCGSHSWSILYSCR